MVTGPIQKRKTEKKVFIGIRITKKGVDGCIIDPDAEFTEMVVRGSLVKDGAVGNKYYIKTQGNKRAYIFSRENGNALFVRYNNGKSSLLMRQGFFPRDCLP